jgi:vancomycin resistance protein YoaR
VKILKKGIFTLIAIITASSLIFFGTQINTSSDSSRSRSGEHHERVTSLTVKKIHVPSIVLIDPKDGKEIQTVKADSIKSQDDIQKIADALELKYDQPMIPARLNDDGKLLQGKPRVILNKEAVVKELNIKSGFDRIIELPITESKPNVAEENIHHLDQAVLARYVTRFDPAVTGRATNIQLSVKEINQIVMGPGDRFYFNLVVGERTAERGYQKAMEIVNKQLVEGIGGGICQTSSTLYNAVEEAGLEIIELHHHSKPVGYVPKDRDATVSFGGKDFKFLNNKNFPILIKTIFNRQQGTLEVQVKSSSQYLANNR